MPKITAATFAQDFMNIRQKPSAVNDVPTTSAIMKMAKELYLAKRERNASTNIIMPMAIIR